MANWLQAAEAICEAMHDSLADTILPTTQVAIGWPTSAEVRAVCGDIANPKALVSIYSMGNSKNQVRYNDDDEIVSYSGGNATLITSNNTVTLSGTLTPEDNIFVYVNRVPYSTTVLMADSYNTILLRLAVKINNANLGLTVVVVGASLTITPTTSLYDLQARDFGTATVYRELLRIGRMYQINVWTSSVERRQAVVDAIILALARVTFLTYADLSKGRILYETDFPNDAELNAGIARHTLVYNLEYAVFDVDVAPLVGAINNTLRIRNNDLLSYDNALVSYVISHVNVSLS